METLIRLSVVNLLISAAIFFAIALSLTLFGTKKKPDAPESDLSFDDLYIDYSGIPELTTFTARDGKPLTYRYYPSGVGQGARADSRVGMAQPVFFSIGRISKF